MYKTVCTTVTYEMSVFSCYVGDLIKIMRVTAFILKSNLLPEMEPKTFTLFHMLAFAFLFPTPAFMQNRPLLQSPFRLVNIIVILLLANLRTGPG